MRIGFWGEENELNRTGRKMIEKSKERKLRRNIELVCLCVYLRVNQSVKIEIVCVRERREKEHWSQGGGKTLKY